MNRKKKISTALRIAQLLEMRIELATLLITTWHPKDKDCAIELMSTKLCSKWTKEIHITYESTSTASRKQNNLTHRKSNNLNEWNVCISVGYNFVKGQPLMKWNNYQRDIIIFTLHNWINCILRTKT